MAFGTHTHGQNPGRRHLRHHAANATAAAEQPRRTRNSTDHTGNAEAATPERPTDVQIESWAGSVTFFGYGPGASQFL